jgi:hypothetical protein
MKDEKALKRASKQKKLAWEREAAMLSVCVNDEDDS